ncbi:protein-L-isoaspartate O-methyltransferase [Kitasatospora sp. MAA4]|uniref:hypothetical protein n=1 Tax=Kitasatospora sp. MAA4 TaxID=3035093 RepID=UPI0024753172|nr:hypothetical protein [Kitasatospora sp. MAA4]MDH6132224.1 protein-L-isoaspartate O-methyltransferase [Kitasatospora sp. MAA4]
MSSWQSLVAEMRASGALTKEWEPSFLAHPRSSFTPDRFHDGEEWIDRTEQPARWLELVNSDVPLVTQLDDGQEDGDGIPTSSLSMPSLVASMLSDVTPADDSGRHPYPVRHHVLQRFTGSSGSR